MILLSRLISMSWLRLKKLQNQVTFNYIEESIFNVFHSHLFLHSLLISNRWNLNVCPISTSKESSNWAAREIFDLFCYFQVENEEEQFLALNKRILLGWLLKCDKHLLSAQEWTLSLESVSSLQLSSKALQWAAWLEFYSSFLWITRVWAPNIHFRKQLGI